MNFMVVFILSFNELLVRFRGYKSGSIEYRVYDESAKRDDGRRPPDLSRDVDRLNTNEKNENEANVIVSQHKQLILPPCLRSKPV